MNDKITDLQYMKAADRLFTDEGSIEVDVQPGPELPTARVSRGDDDGAYVLAWVWVPDTEAQAETDGE